MTKIGTRVGAMVSEKDGVVRFLGYGVYEGDFNYPGYNLLNPRIKLDNGDVVWGLECWWGSENRIKEKLDGATIVMCKAVRDDNGRAIDFEDISQ